MCCLEVVRVCVVDPLVWKGGLPADVCDPLDGASNRPYGVYVVSCAVVVMEALSPSRAEEGSGAGLGIAPEVCPSLDGFGSDAYHWVVFGTQLSVCKGNGAGLGAASIYGGDDVGTHAAGGLDGSTYGGGSVGLHGLYSGGGKNRCPFVVAARGTDALGAGMGSTDAIVLVGLVGFATTCEVNAAV